MEQTLKVTFNEDFNSLCDIFQIKPEVIIQKIISDISFPYFYSHINDKGRWATLMFLDYLDSTPSFNEEDFNFNLPYIEKLSETIERILAQNANDKAKAEAAARKIMKQWHKAVLSERAKYILDKLGNKD